MPKANLEVRGQSWDPSYLPVTWTLLAACCLEDAARGRASHKRADMRTTKIIRKRPGAPRRSQKLCRVLRGWLADEQEDGPQLVDMVQEIWKVILDCTVLLTSSIAWLCGRPPRGRGSAAPQCWEGCVVVG